MISEYKRNCNIAASASGCKSWGREFEHQPGHITFVEVDHWTISRPLSPFRCPDKA